MSTNLRIAVRFLTSKRRSMLMSLAGIVFGVGFFIVTQAQTSGFEQFYIRTVIGTNGALNIEDRLQDTIHAMAAGGHDAGATTFEVAAPSEVRRYVEGVEHPERLIEELRKYRNVAGASVVVRGAAVADSPFRSDPAQVYGIRLEDHLTVSDLAQQVRRGSLADFRVAPNAAVVGSELANRLLLSIGDSFILRAADQQRRYTVAATFETGVREIDRSRIFLHLDEARSLLKKTTDASFIQVDLFDRDRAPQDAILMTRVFGHSVKSWQEREKVWLDVFRALRVSAAITVLTIILISGLGMFNTLAMIVMEKTKEIAILRSMGYTREDIARIFLWQGGLVLAGGCVLGSLFGLGVTWAVSMLPIRIRGIFTTDHFQVAWSHWHYVAAIATATVVVMTASLIPARRAARLEPGDIIRGTAQ